MGRMQRFLHCEVQSGEFVGSVESGHSQLLFFEPGHWQLLFSESGHSQFHSLIMVAFAPHRGLRAHW